MAYFFGDSFDLYTALTDCGGYWDGAFGGTVSLALSSNARFAGSRSLVVAAANAATAPYITKTSAVNDGIHHFVVAVQQTAALTGTAVGVALTLYDGATAQCSVYFRSDGAIVLTSGAFNGATLATYTGAVAAINTWYAFEIEVVVHNTAGSITVRKNGNTSNDFTLGSLNTRASANNYANKIGLGSGSTTAQIIDDFLWRSDAASVPWVGDIRCFTRMPASDAAVQWSRSGSTLPSTPFAQGTTQNWQAANGIYTPFTPTMSGTVGSLTINEATASTANIKCTIYSGSGSVPATALGSATIVTAPGIGTTTFTFGTPVGVTGGVQYWVGLHADTTSGSIGCTSTVSGGWFGAVSYASFPTNNPSGLSANNATAMTVYVTIASPTNAMLVAEPQQDAAVSYVFDSTVGHSDLYGIAAIGSTPSSIVGVTTRGYCQKSDAGTRNVAVQLQSGATNVQSASTALAAGSWSWIARNDLVDPATGAAWTATAVNNAQIGVVVTA